MKFQRYIHLESWNCTNKYILIIRRKNIIFYVTTNSTSKQSKCCFNLTPHFYCPFH